MTKMAARSPTATFTPGLFDFLAELRENNERAWFEANRHRYESLVKEPMLRFIARLGERLPEISPHIVADPRPVGGSLFRIHRDTRFSRDKAPYKTAVAAQFRHEAGKDVHAPGLYLHLEPANSLGGGGIWHPDRAALTRIRDRIVSHPREWQAVLDGGIELEGDSLKRPPPGYAADHAFVEDLKRKDFYVMVRFTEPEVCAADFLERYLDACRSAAPLVSFIARSLDLAW